MSSPTDDQFVIRLLNKVVASSAGDTSFKGLLRSLHLILSQMSPGGQAQVEPFLDAGVYGTLRKISLCYSRDMAIDETTGWLVDRAVLLRCIHVWKLRVRPPTGTSPAPAACLSKPLQPYFRVVQKRLLRSSSADGPKKRAVNWDTQRAFRQWRLLLKARKRSLGVNFANPMPVLKEWRLRTRERLFCRRHLARSAMRRLRLAIMSRAYSQLKAGKAKRDAVLKMQFLWRRQAIHWENARLFEDLRQVRGCLSRWRTAARRVKRLNAVGTNVRWVRLTRGVFLGWSLARCRKRQRARVFGYWHRYGRRAATMNRVADTYWRLNRLLTVRRVIEQLRLKSVRLSAVSDGRLAASASLKRGVVDVWRQALAHRRQSDAVIAQWQRQSLLRRFFSGCWHRQCRKSWQAGEYRLFITAKQHLRVWHGRGRERLQARETLRTAWDAWTRRLQLLRGLRFFYGRLLLRRQVLSDGRCAATTSTMSASSSLMTVSRASVDQCINRLVCWQFWASKAARAVDYGNYRQMKRVHRWHAAAILRRISQRCPTRVKVHALRRLGRIGRRVAGLRRQFTRHLHERQERAAFVGRFRAFRRWEQAFQLRRMEAHLCAQNLCAYQARAKHAIFTSVWRLQAVKRVLVKVRSVQTRSASFGRWRAIADAKERGAQRRVQTRAVRLWRAQLVRAVQDRCLAALQRKRLRQHLHALVRGSVRGVGYRMQRAGAHHEQVLLSRFLHAWRAGESLPGRLARLAVSPGDSNDDDIPSTSIETRRTSTKSKAASSSPPPRAYSAIYALLSDLKSVREMARDGRMFGARFEEGSTGTSGERGSPLQGPDALV